MQTLDSRSNGPDIVLGTLPVVAVAVRRRRKNNKVTRRMRLNFLDMAPSPPPLPPSLFLPPLHLWTTRSGLPTPVRPTLASNGPKTFLSRPTNHCTPIHVASSPSSPLARPPVLLAGNVPAMVISRLSSLSLDDPSLPAPPGSLGSYQPPFPPLFSPSPLPRHAYALLPPGLALRTSGNVFDSRDDFETTGSGSGDSRKSSSSDSCSASSVASTSSLVYSSISSLGSIGMGEGEQIGRRKRDEEGMFEDPTLTEARRALWEDVPSSPRSGSVGRKIYPDEGTDAGDEQGSSSSDEEEGGTDLQPLPSPSKPSHATLPPLASCLRPPSHSRPPSRSSSHSSSSTTTTPYSLSSSVQFASSPPEKAVTYSGVDYERGGEGQVEKLSMREWVELREVREAVGLWSGKIARWEGDIPQGEKEKEGRGRGHLSVGTSLSSIDGVGTVRVGGGEDLPTV